MAPQRHEVDYRTIALRAEGKLRGSRARRLGDELAALWSDGYDQVVLDIRGCGSLDSVGGLALQQALDLGQRLFLVVEPGLEPFDVLPPEVVDDPRLRVFGDPAEAVRDARAHEESGVLVP